jgi:beta-lactamase superfamily II metal-dependent hydrolase
VLLSRPAPDQIEVTVIGPGFGECIIVHLGADNWIVIDSCIDASTGEPVALKYFRERNVGVERVVRVIATHWHDDHIRGMARQLAAFPNARFCTSSALTRNEFVASIVKYDSRHGIVAGSGASEICEVLEILESRVGATTPMRASPGRTILDIPGSQSGHGNQCTVKTLSPSDKQFQKFLESLGSFAPPPFAAKKRVPDQDPNDLSVAVLVSIGEQGILLGADLEESGDGELGWSAVLQVEGLPKNTGRIFKIPHHGSENGNCDEVWTDLLIANPLAIITPWNRNKGLPKRQDVERIQNQTHSGFITSFVAKTLTKERPYPVEKQIRETVGRLRPVQNSTGFFTARNGGKQNPLTWCIWHSDNACHLKDWKAA